MDKKLTRLEEGLSPREKAALAFALEGKGEWDEADRIAKSVPTGLFRIRDLTYLDRSNRLMLLALAWGFMYWQQVAKREMAHRWLLHLANRGDGVEGIDGLMEAIDWAEGKLVALDAMLGEVCAANGVDAQAVRRIVDVEGPYKPTGFATPDPDPEFIAKIRECLSRLAA